MAQETYTTPDGRVFDITDDGASATLAGTSITPSAQVETSPASPAYEVSRSLADRVTEFQRGFLETNPEGFAQFSNKRLLEYAQDNFPGGAPNIQKALKRGATEEQILSQLYGFSPKGGIEAGVEGVQRGFLESTPTLAGGVMGFKIGVETSPVVAGLSGPAAPVTVPLYLMTTTGIGAASGYLFGDTVSDTLLGDDPKFAPSARPIYEGGYTLGSGIPLPFSTYAFTQKLLPNASSLADRVVRMNGIKETPIQAIQRTALEQPGRFMAVEGAAIGQAAVAGGIADANYPGDVTMRFLFEAGAGSTSPLVVSALEKVGKGLAGTVQMFTRAGREQKQANTLFQYLIDNGQNPEKILKRLRSPDAVAEFAKEMGVVMPEKRPTANVAFNEVTSELQNALAKDKTFGPTLRKALAQDYQALTNLVEVMDASGNPALMAQASRMRERIMEGAIIQRLSDALDQAKRVNKSVAPVKRDDDGIMVIGEDGPVPDTRAAMQAGRTIEATTAKVIGEARKAESAFYDQIDGSEEIDVPLFLQALDEIETQIGGPIPYLPPEVKRLVLRLRGLDPNEADTDAARISVLEGKIATNQDGINDIQASDPTVGTYFKDELTPSLQGNTPESQLNIVQNAIKTIEETAPAPRVAAAKAPVTGASRGEVKLTPYGKLKQKLGGTNALINFERELDLVVDDDGMRIFRGNFTAFDDLPTSQAIEALTQIEQRALARTKNVGPNVVKSQKNIAKLAELFREDLVKRRAPRGNYAENDPRSDLARTNPVLLRVFEDFLARGAGLDLSQPEARQTALRQLSRLRRNFIEIQQAAGTIDQRQRGVATGGTFGEDQRDFDILRDVIKRLDRIEPEAVSPVSGMKAPQRNRLLTALRNQAKILNNTIQIREIQSNMLVDEADAAPITLEQVMFAKSRLQDEARGYTQNSEFNEARILGKLAGGLVDDIGIKSGGVRQEDGSITFDETADATKVLSENQIAIRNAYNFSRKFNDVFTRAFPAKIAERDSSGARHIMPELLHKSLFSGGGDETSLKFDQMNQSMVFLANELGAETVKRLGVTANLGTMTGAQETLTRVAFEELVDPTTGRVSVEALNKFKKDYRNVLFLENGTPRFPDLIKDLSSVEAAERTLLKRIRETGDPRADTAAGSPLGNNTPAKGYYQEKLAGEISYKNSLGADVDPMGLVGSVVANPGSSKASDPKGLKTLIRNARRAEAKHPGASGGLRSMIMQKARLYATSVPNKAGDTSFNFAKYKEYLTRPMAPGQPSVLDLIRQEGLIDEGYALRLTEIMNVGVQSQRALAQSGEALNLNVITPKTERLFQLAVRLGGLRAGRLATQVAPGQGQGLAEPMIAANEFQRILVETPNSEVFGILEKAALDKDFYALLLEKGIANNPRAQVASNKRLRSAFLNAGFIGSTSEQRSDPQSQVTLPRSGYGRNNPSLRARTDDVKARALDLIGDQSSAAPVMPPQQPVPAQPVAQPTTTLASAAPPPPPASRGSVDRTRYAAMFPNDPASALIRQQGIGSLMG